MRVVRAAPGLVWRAVDDGEVVGAVSAFLRPDDRWFVSFDQCQAGSHEPLLAAVAANTGSDLHVVTGEEDAEALARYAGLGFTVSRREAIFLIPTDPAVTGLRDGAPPGEFLIVSALDADAELLRLLDEALRADVPGSDGWHWDPSDFHEETFGPDFDPATYLVAVDPAACDYAGLVRVWTSPGRPRLGLVGVRPQYRRLGLARALLARAFHTLHERGKGEVSAEVDEADARAVALLASLGARRRTGLVELLRPFGTD